MTRHYAEQLDGETLEEYAKRLHKLHGYKKGWGNINPSIKRRWMKKARELIKK